MIRKLGAVSLLLLLATPAVVRAQEGVIAGTVLVEGLQRPILGAQIVVSGVAGKGAIADAQGKFRITGLTGATVSINVRAIGYRQVTEQVRVGNTAIRILMQERALELNAMVVTGTAGGAQKRELGTSVAPVKVSDIIQTAAVPSVEDLLKGRAAGVAIIQTSGQIGAGSQVRIRGIGTFSLSSTPLMYVDGIRVDNALTGQVSRFNDFDPEQIESIEVLKGPAAATLYGTEAARGVINIITKRGATGQTRYTFTMKQGNQWFQNSDGRIPVNYWWNPADSTVWSVHLPTTEAARGTPLFKNGPNYDYSASVSGGTGTYKYYASAGLSQAEGITTQNSRTQKTVRTNLSVVPNSQFSLESSVGYVTSRTNLAIEGSGGGVLWASEYSRPTRTIEYCTYTKNTTRGCGWSRGAYTSPPEVYNASLSWQDLRRFTGSLNIKYEPFKWLSNRVLIGTDYTLEDIQGYTPYQTDSVIVFFQGTGFDGSRSVTTQQTTFNTYDYSSSISFQIRPELRSKTAFGIQYYTNQGTNVAASGTHFPTPGLSTITATGTKGTPTSNTTANNTLGFYGQEDVSLNDRLFVSAALRVDNNSAFGSKANWVQYPKLSLSWVASEEPKVRAYIPKVVGDLRFRIAYGGSGQQPGVNTALRTLSPVAGPNSSTVLTPGTFGNENLKPERVMGLETGFEAALFNDRVGVDFTYYSDVSHDAILSRSVAPSTGFGASSQFVNAGQIDKHGLELSLKTQIINQPSYGWEMQFNVGSHSSKIKKLTGSDTMIVIGTAPPIAHKLGYSPFDLFTYDVVSATYDKTTRKATEPQCADGKGSTMPCFATGTTSVQAPLIYMGHSIPTTEGSVANTFRYKMFKLHVLTDFQSGFSKLDNNLRIRCQLNATCPEAVWPDKYDPAAVAVVQNSGTLRDYFIKTANFWKLREVSLSYDAPERLARKYLGSSGVSATFSVRNIHTWTNYTGLDPENSLVSSGGSSSGIGIDQAEYPPLASALLTIRISY
jgi:TonB-linked SusC/RagA family outer membrane protein